MSVIKVIRYRTEPESAEENADLIGNVFSELNQEKPDGLRYSALRLEDGVSFVHIAVLEGETNPLQTSPAFAAFQRRIADRIVEGPISADATVVGNFRLLPD